jgi:2-polyprenyl-3-methyl-5-hydroxy-6-metoxy-1,4-benzoquinol methylase
LGLILITEIYTMSFLKRAYRKAKRILSGNQDSPAAYDFNKANPLGGNGERVDIQLNKGADFERMDMYQKSHWKRYEYAREIVNAGEICGDFACGTGYGSILISDKAKSVIGADLNSVVIAEITERYKENRNTRFLNENLLNLSFEDHFDTIVSFETMEHFAEHDIVTLLKIFNKALKQNGRLIFSTPYLQEKSEEAIKMGFHLTFYIDMAKIGNWLNDTGFRVESIKYQNYDTHFLRDDLEKKDFIICVARKISN